MYFINVTVVNVVVSDSNGASIVSEYGNNIANIVLNPKENKGSIKVDGDFGNTKLKVENPTAIILGNNATLKELSSLVKDFSITIKDEKNQGKIAEMIGEITGEVPGELNNIKAKVDENSEFLKKLNNIKAEAEELMDEYNARGKAFQKIIEEQKIFQLEKDYTGLSDKLKLEVAQDMRTYLQNNKFTTIKQVVDRFNECKKQTVVSGEYMKYKGQYNSGSSIPVIDKDIEAGTDITDIIMELVEGQVKNDDIEVTIERAYNDNVLVKDGRIFLNKVNNTGEDISTGVDVNFKSKSLGFSLTTNIMATLKSKTAKPTEKITAVELPADIVNIKSDNNTQEFSGGKSTFFNTTVNKERLPKDIKDKFSKISVPMLSVSTADFKIDEKYKNELLTRNSSGVPYTPEGFASVVTEYDSYPTLALYSMVILYDDNDNPIAYTIVKIK